jgi:hypothetical protein
VVPIFQSFCLRIWYQIPIQIDTSVTIVQSEAYSLKRAKNRTFPTEQS